MLVDGEVGLTSTDRTALDMLQEFGVPFVVCIRSYALSVRGASKLKSLFCVVVSLHV